ncbi:MAG: hypothetical protein AMXMBFR4_09460 [Candidatus Hydrogenedentota bacterium]
MRNQRVRYLVYGLVLSAALAYYVSSSDSRKAMKGFQLPKSLAAETGSSSMVRVRVIGPDGKLTGPVDMPRLVLPEEEWQKRLTPEQFAIVRAKGTEPAYCGTLLDNKREGYYVCVACNLPLFHSGSKFNSGTGWPSFYQPVAEENIREEADLSHGMKRTEILCARCDGHLGHVFDDGPRPTGLRYCLNSESLRFVDEADVKSIAEEPPVQLAASQPYVPKSVTRLPGPVDDIPLAEQPGEAKAVLAGGCFWCTEAVFEGLEGVKDVVSGYSGDERSKADYEIVSTGRTNHAEAIEITYDPSKVTFGQLLRIFFGTHDPTTKNQQGADRGPQYRSAIFYADDRQKDIAQKYIKLLDESGKFPKPIVTTLEPLEGFYPAERYHQNFVKKNPDHPYVQAVALPKVKKRDELLEADREQ